MYEKILVPLDGSNASEIVMPYAEEIAAKAGGEITLASVSELPRTDTDHLFRSYLEKMGTAAKKRMKDADAKSVARIKTEVLVGQPAHEIIRYANEWDISLIAMASRGSSGSGPWILGNVAAKVLRLTGKPVLLIRIPADDMSPRRKRLIGRILVPLDGSEVGETAIPYAEALAEELTAELVLFQVLHPIVIAVGHQTTYVPTPEDEEGMKAAAIDYLDGIASRFKEKGLIVSSQVAFGSPADQIIDFAEANSVDLIAMSSHGRSGVTRWVFGSVSDKVLHAGDTPVLLIRATKG